MYTIITECLLYYGKCLRSDSINIVEAVYIMPWDNVKAHNSTECRQSVYIMMALVLIIYEGTCLLCAIKRLCLPNEVIPSIYLMKPSQNSLTASYVRPCIFWRLWKMKMELKCTLKYLIISFCFVQVDWLTHKWRQAWLSRRGDGPSHKVGAKITLKPKKWLHITYINITWCSKSVCTIENFVH